MIEISQRPTQSGIVNDQLSPRRPLHVGLKAQAGKGASASDRNGFGSDPIAGPYVERIFNVWRSRILNQSPAMLGYLSRL